LENTTGVEYQTDEYQVTDTGDKQRLREKPWNPVLSQASLTGLAEAKTNGLVGDGDREEYE
jgi:hypothetical protein